MVHLKQLLAASLVSSATATTLSNSTQYVSTASEASCACSKLSSLYTDKLIYPNSTNYTTEATAQWDLRSTLEPACIFLPTSAEEVASAVTELVACDAQFAVRGGGHMNFPGASNINNGVLIALSSMKNIQIAADNNTVELGPGLTLYEAYSYLEPYSRVLIGGRLKTIGLSGLTLGGGVHYFINKYGYAMDNVLSYDVVIGNGTLLTANATSNPDLFWALKGGSSNYGIVTKFTSKVYDIPVVSVVSQVFNESAVPAFCQAAVDLASVDNATVGAGGVFIINYNATTKAVNPQILGMQEGASLDPSQFANFSAIPSVSKFNNITTAAQWASNLDSPFQELRVVFGHHTSIANATNIYQMYLIWKSAVDELADVEGLIPTFVLNLSPRTAARVALNNGIGNVWGTDDQTPYINWQLSTSWTNAADDLRIQAWSQAVVAKIDEMNREVGTATDFVYMNDAGEWQVEQVWAGIPKENLERMVEIRERYDPGLTFRKLSWGGFKLPL